MTVTQYRERTESIDVVARAVAPERLSVEGLEAINLRTGNGGVVSLAQLAKLHFELEEPILWRRNKELLMTVRAGVVDGVQGPDVAARIDKALAPLRADLPAGYRIEVGGDKEESAKSQGSIFKMMPVMAFLMIMFLMLQLQSFSKLALVVLTAPLGLIGVSLFLLVFNQPFGFVSLLGVIALAGMIMRNSVILVDQIDQDIAAGHSKLGRRDRRHRAPRPADPAHRRHRHLRHDPAVAQRVLGAHGGRPDGRPAGGDGAHPALPAGALCRLVQGQAAGRQARAGRVGGASATGPRGGIVLRKTTKCGLQPYEGRWCGWR